MFSLLVSLVGWIKGWRIWFFERIGNDLTTSSKNQFQDILCFASLQNKSGRMGSESFESFELSDSQRGWIWEGIFVCKT